MVRQYLLIGNKGNPKAAVYRVPVDARSNYIFALPKNTGIHLFLKSEGNCNPGR